MDRYHVEYGDGRVFQGEPFASFEQARQFALEHDPYEGHAVTGIRSVDDPTFFVDREGIHAYPGSLSGDRLREAATEEWVAMADTVSRSFQHIPIGSFAPVIPGLEEWEDSVTRDFIKNVREMRRRIEEAD
jgi:hypothetical protein